MGALVHILLSPLFVGIALGVVLALAWRHLPLLLRWLGCVLLLACYVFCTPLGADPLLHFVAAPVERPCPPPAPRAVVVLAGGADALARAGNYGALNQASLRRAIGGVALWRRQPAGTPLALSGGAPASNVSEASLMAELARDLGVPDAAIRTETTSSSTWQNAQHLAALQPPLPRRVWLVTSAVHMPRALYAMRKAGFRPCAAPVDIRYQRPHRWTDLLPSAGAIGKTNAALHELAGLAWYRVSR
ncbi:MAG TPA: YdcF family protein [Rhodanobacteraceae bacterium]|nr:YdcF family protein [Rhodanobacteraceae bacterium]